MKKNKILKTILLLAAGALVYSILNAVVWFNGPPNGFNPPGKSTLESLSIDAASLFLQSQADAFLLLNEREIGDKNGFNFAAAWNLVVSTRERLARAQALFVQIVAVGHEAGYDPAVSEKLKKFDYQAFIASQGLNRPVMEEVALFLSAGDIIGLYNRNIEKIGDILKTLDTIQEKLKAGQVPELDLFWQLLQRYADNSLFGNYATLVFNQF